MVRIEKLTPGTKLYVMRNNVKTQIFLNQLIEDVEFSTVMVEGGTLIYSINETEVKEMTGQGQQLELNLTEVVTDAVDIAEAIKVEPTVVAATVTPTMPLSAEHSPNEHL